MIRLRIKSSMPRHAQTISLQVPADGATWCAPTPCWIMTNRIHDSEFPDYREAKSERMNAAWLRTQFIRRERGAGRGRHRCPSRRGTSDRLRRVWQRRECRLLAARCKPKVMIWRSWSCASVSGLLMERLSSWPSWISARVRSHSRLGTEGQKGPLITNALARPFSISSFLTRRPRLESQLLLSGSA